MAIYLLELNILGNCQIKKTATEKQLRFFNLKIYSIFNLFQANLYFTIVNR